jgi:hypothetical protein
MTRDIFDDDLSEGELFIVRSVIGHISQRAKAARASPGGAAFGKVGRARAPAVCMSGRQRP